jgi:hypothetical protein
MESGTATKTSVSKETSDLDDACATFQALAGEKAAAGTKTFTFVPSEDAGEDSRQPYFRGAPRSVSSENDGTMTVTAIKAETADADYNRCRALLAIPPCS